MFVCAVSVIGGQDGRNDRLGWLLVGCGGFGVMLGLGLIFWVDRSDEAPRRPGA